MSLLTTVTSDNRQILSGLVISYSRERIKGSWTFQETIPSPTSTTYSSIWQYTRRATKHYKYTGLDYDTAIFAASEFVEFYTRQTKFSDVPATGSNFVDIDGGTVLMANVACNHVEGEMWEIDISVDEVDTRLNINAVSPSSLFTAENQRDYDE